MASENRSGRGQGQPSFAPLYAEDAPQPPTPWALRLFGPAIAFLMHGIQDMRVTGTSALADSGPAIIVANHTSYLDGLTVGTPLFQVGIAPRFGARADLFSAPVLGWLLKGGGQIPVHRRGDYSQLSQNDASFTQGLDELEKALEDGYSVCLFPEGTFTCDPDGWAMRARTGAARLALAHPEIPVVPVAHWGNERLVDPWTARPNFRLFGRRTTTVQIRFGKPVDLSQFMGQPVTKELLMAVSDAIMDAINDELEILRRSDRASEGIKRRQRLWDRQADGCPNQVHFDVFNTNLHERVAKRLARKDKKKG